MGFSYKCFSYNQKKKTKKKNKKKNKKKKQADIVQVITFTLS